MGKAKGCTNKLCIANQKETTFKEENDYCPKCGNKLQYVCKKCHTQLPGDSVTDKYCVRCIAKKKDQKDDAVKLASGLGGLAITIGTLAISRGKSVVKMISRLK